jgi:arylsulfatase A-like enzyme
MDRRYSTSPCFLAALGLLTAIPSVVAADTPNIILVLADDLGWTDTSVRMMAGRPESRSEFYHTPALERLAREGMVFSNAYSPAPTCTPTRSSIQFGKTPARLRQTVVHDVLAKKRGIDCANEISIAQMIKAVDPTYVTAHFGKWGFPPRRPEHAGYDVTDGNTNNGDGDYVSVKDRAPLPPDDPKRLFSLTKRANAFVEQQVRASRPFFMQVSHYAVHVQHHALDTTIQKYQQKMLAGQKPRSEDALYAAMIEDLDTGLGMLLDKLDELRVANNTYIIFTSDNGGGYRSNAPLRGGKANLWEGGIRVPTVVRGPGVMTGAQCDIAVAGWDFWATIRDLAGGGSTSPDGIDGGSLRSLFEKGNEGRVQRGAEALVFHFPWYDKLPMSAIRLGDYKLVRNLNTGETRLFDVVKDIGEQRDLSQVMPEKAESLNTMLTQYLQNVGAETIADMRSARQEELLGFIARTQSEIDAKREHLKTASDDNQQRQLQDQLKDRHRRLNRHREALERLENARRITTW